jgi:hypothetical protein
MHFASVVVKGCVYISELLLLPAKIIILEGDRVTVIALTYEG